MANLSIINGYRLLPLAAGLNYSMVDDTGPRPRILGGDVYEDNSMDGTLTGSAADYTVVSGDFQQYAIVDRVGTRLRSCRTSSGRTTGRSVRGASTCISTSAPTA